MKRVIMAAVLLVSTVSVFATESKGELKKEEKRIEVKIQNVDKGECTYSASATIGPSWAKVEVKCSYTSTSCKEAISQVNKCLDDARKAIM